MQENMTNPMKSPKKKPICEYCYDKGFYTVFQGAVGRGYEVLPHPQKRRCSMCDGRPRAYARKQLKGMLIGVREGGFITPVIERIMKWL